MLQDWIDRYHVALGVGGLVIGVVLAFADGAVASFRYRAVAVATAAAILFVAADGGFPAAMFGLLPMGVVVILQRRDAPQNTFGALSGLLSVMSLVGVWLAVPDTEPALVAGTVLAPMALVRWRSGRGMSVDELGFVWILVVGSAALGAAGGPAWVGGAGCLGVLGVGWSIRDGKVVSDGGVVAIHLVGVLVSARAITRIGLPVAVGAQVIVFGVEALLLSRLPEFGVRRR